MRNKEFPGDFCLKDRKAVEYFGQTKFAQLDGFVGRVDDLTNDNEIGTDQIHELSETAKNHEKRIAKLESVN